MPNPPFIAALTPSSLMRLMQSLAVLDAIVCPEVHFRYYSFNSRWGADEMLGKINNGMGDDLFVLFNSAGCFLKGFAHEYQHGAPSPEMFYRDVPAAFKQLAQEPAFSPEYVSYCYWRLNDGHGWESSVTQDTIDADVHFLLADLVGNPVTYMKFATDCYEVNLDADPVASVINQRPVSKAIATALNPEINYPELMIELDEIGFPYALEK